MLPTHAQVACPPILVQVTKPKVHQVGCTLLRGATSLCTLGARKLTSAGPDGASPYPSFVGFLPAGTLHLLSLHCCAHEALDVLAGSMAMAVLRAAGAAVKALV